MLAPNCNTVSRHASVRNGCITLMVQQMRAMIEMVLVWTILFLVDGGGACFLAGEVADTRLGLRGAVVLYMYLARPKGAFIE